MNAITKIKARIDEITAENAKTKEAAESAARKAENDIRAAAEKMNIAIEAGNVAAYSAAKKEKAEAEDALEMYTAKIDAIGAGNLITSEEYRAGIDALFADLEAEKAEAKKQILEAAAKIGEIGESFKNNVSAANHLLHVWQFDIFRDSRVYIETASGNKVFNPGAEVRYKDTGIIVIAAETSNSAKRLEK